jgi:hypothetical protein
MTYSGESHGGHSGHGPSFSDLFVGLELASGLTGHSISIADAAALAAIASEVAQTHSGPSEPHGFETGYAHEVPALAHSGWHAGETGLSAGVSVGREVSLPGVARDANKIEVLEWPHSACDAKNQIELLARQAGMVVFPVWEVNIAGLIEFDHTEGRILPLEQRHNVPAVMPNGWHPGWTGSTRRWCEFFRIRPSWLPAKLAVLFPFFGPPNNFEHRRTFLIVIGSSWHYDQPADYETRVAFMVYSLKFVEGSQWTYDWNQIRQYRDRAEILAKGLKKYLKQHPPMSDSIERRRIAD